MASTASLTTALNPADPNEILLFYMSPNGDLTMADRPLTKPEEDETEGLEYKATAAKPAGMIISPSSLVSIEVKKKVEVWGIASSNQQVVRLSPAIKYLGPNTDTTGNTHSLGAASNGKIAWLYYIKSGTSGMKIGEFQVGKGELSKMTITPFAQTSLAATWVGPKSMTRLVFYQDGNKLLHAVDPEGPSDSSIQGTSSAKASTPLAAVTLPSKRVVIYFLDSNNHINRSIRDSKTKEWGGVNQVKTGDNEPTVTSLSALSATVAPEYVRLTYVSDATGTARYETYDDDLGLEWADGVDGKPKAA